MEREENCNCDQSAHLTEELLKVRKYLQDVGGLLPECAVDMISSIDAVLEASGYPQ
jgi:hypothetical protein